VSSLQPDSHSLFRALVGHTGSQSSPPRGDVSPFLIIIRYVTKLHHLQLISQTACNLHLLITASNTPVLYLVKQISNSHLTAPRSVAGHHEVNSLHILDTSLYFLIRIQTETFIRTYVFLHCVGLRFPAMGFSPVAITFLKDVFILN